MNGLILTTQEGVRIFEEMVSCRRAICADNEFPKMTDVWQDLCEGSKEWKIKFYRRGQRDLDRPQAAVAEFDQHVRLTVSEELWADAESGDGVSNFILAHELGHVGERHNARFATRHFQMASTAKGHAILPKSYYEKVADFAAVAFQCGVALLDENLSGADLAKLAFSDLEQVQNAQRMVQSKVFRREFARPRVAVPREVF
jgi:hypothetical protein